MFYHISRTNGIYFYELIVRYFTVYAASLLSASPIISFKHHKSLAVRADFCYNNLGTCPGIIKIRVYYVASVFCSTGKTPEEAINALYAQAAGSWKGLSDMFPDIPANPLVTEFDEIIPVDIADTTPWYQEYRRDTEHIDPADDDWVYGNDAAMRRWTHEQ